MKIGIELEFVHGDDLSDSFEKEYYDDMWEKSDYLFEGTPTLCVRQLRKWVAEVVETMPVGSVFNTSRSIGRAMHKEPHQNSSEDSEVLFARVWTGLHIHLQAKDHTPDYATSYRMSSYLSCIFNRSYRQKNSHHLWGGVHPDSYVFDYQKKCVYRPVSSRPSIGTYEIRIMDFTDLLLPSKVLEEIFRNLQKIIDGKTYLTIQSDIVQGKDYDNIFVVQSNKTLGMYRGYHHVSGWTLPISPCLLKEFFVSKGFLRQRATPMRNNYET